MAKYQLLLPKMGESVAEATVIKWVKKPGDYIEMDEAVMEIATDKVDSEVPSPVSGKLIEQRCKEDEVVQVGEVIAVIETDEPEAETPAAEEQPAPEPEPVKEPEPVAGEPQEQTPPEPAQQDSEPVVKEEEPAIPPAEPVIQHFDAIPGIDLLPASGLANGFKSTATSGRFYSPLVKSIAMQENVNAEELDSIPGTGLEGRLTKDDLIQYIQQRHMRPPVAKVAAPAETVTPEPVQPQPAQAVEAPAAEHQPEEPAAHGQGPETVIPELEIPVMAATEAEEPAAAAIEPEEAEEPIPEEVPAEAPAEEVPAVETPEVEAPVEEVPHQQEPVQQPVAEVEVQAEEPVAEESFEQPVTETAAPVQEPVKSAPAYAEIKSYPGSSLSGGDEIIEMDRMRRLIAEHMVYSKHTSPHVTSFVEADVTHIVTWREKHKAAFEKQTGEKLTYTPIFIEAVVKAITDFPLVNVTVNGTRITKKKDINIGMATALPNGNLIVPVIKKASDLNLLGLTKSVNDLANRARNSKLVPDDVKDGTFTITNVGSFGNLMGTPIINQPQVAILAVGVIKKKPAVIETPDGDFIGIRHMMFLSLSYDHRVVDGALGGSFLRKIADYLEGWDVNRKI